MTSPIARADRALGQTVEKVVTSHHRRRLRRAGWERAAAAPPGWWAEGDPAPRPGNAFELLVDGAEALEAIAAGIRSARSQIHLAGWQLNPGFAVSRRDTPVTVRELLAEAASRIDVRVLLWAGAPLPLFRPSRADVKKGRDALCEGTPIRCALDARERPMHCHHEKTIVIDDRLAFVGGIDLTDFAGDRYDSNAHPFRGSVGWHDAAARLEGPAVRDVAEHFRMRWQAVTGELLPASLSPAVAGSVEVQVVRTVPDHMYPQRPAGDFRVLEIYLRALRAASRFIYLENQFLWSPEVLAVLRDKLRRPPSSDFRLLVVLPAKPNSGGDDTRGQLGTLMQADDGSGRLLACTIYARGQDRDSPVYVHAKVGIVDDRWLTVGSANLNEHSLFNDTEMNLAITDGPTVTRVRRRLWSEHLERPVGDLERDPVEVIDRLWKPIAHEQAERRRRGDRPTHRLTLLPGVSKSWGLLLGPIQGLLIDA